MSSFDAAYAITVEQEGGLADDPNDHGGITNKGISLRFLQSCGLAYDFDHNGIVDEREIRNLTDDQARLVYKLEFFYPLSCINNQSILNYLFDTAVDCGISQAIKILQRALCAAFETMDVKIDGILGKKTLDLFNNSDDIHLISEIRSERAGYYRLLASHDPSQIKFLNGWLKRAYTLKV